MSDEAKTLQSQILFGSSHCSCSSCESILCFAKRNRELNKCNCPTCQELGSCLYITKNKDEECYESLNVPTENIPCHITKEISVNKFKTPTTRGKIDNKNIVSIRLFKRNVIVQAKPQCYDIPIMNKCKINSTTNENNDVKEYSPITYIVNKVLTTYNDISLRDIIEKIKKVYKACSCKVCDCVANDINVCKCKPCECIECKSYLKDNDDEKISNVFNYYPVNDEAKETYSGYNRNTNDSLKLHSSVCSCKPCDCELCRMYTIKLKESMQSYLKNPEVNEPLFYKTKSSKNIDNKQTEICSCKPCQCIKCMSPFNMPNKVVVGSVTEHLQSTDCTCVPCDCADCRSAIPSTSPHLMRETSTDMAETTNCRCDICFSHSCRQTRETCGCESRNSVINKPFEKDTKDIDIHRALITKSKGKTDQIEQTCTISVLTKIIKDYKKREARKAKKSKSEDTNKCLKCNSRMRCSSSLCEKSHYSTHHVKKIEVTKCQCSPCECDICEKLKTVDNGVWKSVKFRSKCFCDVCRCIYCGGELQTQNEADNEQDRPQTSHCGKKSENTSTFTSHQSMYPALLCEYPKPVNENAPMYNSNHYESDNLFKYTCDDCIRMVNGDKNEIKEIHSDLSGSFCSCRAINSCHEPSHNLCSAEMLNFYESKHSLSDNKVVNNFVNEIMQIDEIKTNVEHENQNESSNSFDSTSWSFQEQQTRQNNSKNSVKNTSEENENTIQKQEAEVNEPCVFCGTFTLNTFSTNTGHKEGIQIIRECFAKTNLALLNDFDVNKEENENSISEDSDNGNLDENTQDSKDEFEYNDDYFEERSILFKAKLLTSELLKMLYEFQKANKDFDAFKNNSDYDTKSEENRENLRSSQLGNMPRQDLLQILSLESKWNINGDTKLQENITNIENCQEDNVPFTNFKYSWSKTVLVNKRKNQIFPCYSKTDLTNDLNEFNYSETIYTEERTELGFKKINNNLAGNMNYLTRAEDLPKFKQSSIFENEFSDNMQDCNRTINRVKYSNFEALNYADIVSAKTKKICDDNRHILIENIFQNTKHEVNSK